MIQTENAVVKYKEIILDELHEWGVDCWVAGGSVRDYFMGIPVVTDHDLFFRNEKDYAKAKDFFEKKDAELLWDSENGTKFKYKGRRFDLIKHYYVSPTACIHSFDFTVSMLAVDRANVYAGETSFIDLAKRQLMINELPFPINTMARILRYYKKGFTMCIGELRKVILAIQKTDVLEENEDSGNKNDDNATSLELGGLFIGID
jgi:hypothetical protein